MESVRRSIGGLRPTKASISESGASPDPDRDRSRHRSAAGPRDRDRDNAEALERIGVNGAHSVCPSSGGIDGRLLE